MRHARGCLDYLAVVEALYASSPSEDDWVQGIAEVACRTLDRGRGVNVWTYDLNVPTSERVRAFHGAGADTAFERGARRFLAVMPPRFIPSFYSASPPVEVMSRIFSRQPPTAEMIAAMAESTVGDAIGVRGHNPDGRGVTLGVATVGTSRIAPRERWVLTRIGLHMAAAARLRMHAPESWLDTAEAIFSAKGRLEHTGAQAEGGDLPPALPEAVEKRVAANAVRTEPAKALELWRALVDGRWSIVDHADRDGKRFILARRNAPAVREPAALTARERMVAVYAAWGHSNRLISYETGISEAAISSALASVLRKLRLRSRAELIRFFGSDA
jgi:DNA-binding CsgD family transcriptional regulator